VNDRVGIFRLDDGGLGVTELGSPEILKIDEIDNNFKNKILCGDVREVLKKLPDECVDMSVTSPPYFFLRDYHEEGVIWGGDKNCEHEWNIKETKIATGYSDKSTIIRNRTEKYAGQIQKNKIGFCNKCGAWKGQLGLESDLDQYVNHLCDVFDEVKRVLKPEGTCWVNIGDTYAGSGCKLPHHKIEGGKQLQQVLCGAEPKEKPAWTILDKSLCGIPFRFSLEMARRGWGLRNTIIWHKINQIPSSAKDRFTVNFEYLLFFFKNKDYYFEQQFESYEEPLKRWGGEVIKAKNQSEWDTGTGQKTFRDRNLRPNLQGRNKRTTWAINTQPLADNHFACVDTETECLTENGWRDVNTIKLEDKIATFDLINEKIIYHKPYQIFRYDFDGELVVIDNSRISQHVTPNHNVLLKYCHIEKMNKKFPKIPDPIWHFEKANTLKRPYSGIRIPSAGNYDGKYSIGKEKAELLGWLITEGMKCGVCKNRSKKSKCKFTFYIYQSLSANKDKVERIEYLLKKSNQMYIKRTRKRWYFSKKINKWKENESVEFVLNKTQNDNSWILEWITNDKKITPNWNLLHLVNDELYALYEGLIGGDGHRRPDKRDCFIQKSDYVREWFRTLCVHINLRTFENKRQKRTDTVFVTNQNYSQIHQKYFKKVVSTKKYKGIVWCPYVPNSTWVARRDGKIFITGNSYPVLLIETPIKAGCPEFICKKCGEKRKKVYKEIRIGTHPGIKNESDLSKYRQLTTRVEEGYTKCKCNAGFESGIVLDPFIGSGTTAISARKLGRDWVGIEINEEYCQMAKKRILKTELK